MKARRVTTLTFEIPIIDYHFQFDEDCWLVVSPYGAVNDNAAVISGRKICQPTDD